MQALASQSLFSTLGSELAPEIALVEQFLTDNHMLWNLWFVGYVLYLTWMCVCFAFNIIFSALQALTLSDWTTSIPNGFITCQAVIQPYL